ncbi:thrombospondin type 3 repeat-containing protein [Acetobacterium woodii]|nr:thrombospondin type 3 repeat-containing protein [Acetobacterium woodii]
MKNFKWRNALKTGVVGMILISMLSIGVTGCAAKSSGSNTGTSSQQSTTAAKVDTDGDGIPDSDEKILGTNPYTPDTDGDGSNDKVDTQPVFTKNLIVETSTTPLPIKINDLKVEDNATADHLEMTLVNTGQTILNNFDIYYTIADNVTNQEEAYYELLNGLTLNPGETKTIHFDNKISEAGHFFGNINGLYGTSQNGLTFNIQLHANGYAPLNFNVDKAKGTAEVAD